MRKEERILRVFSVLLVLLAFTATSQEQTLQQQFDQMIQESNTYEQYKVIPIQKINGFWSETMDSLKSKDRSIVRVNGRVIGLEAMIDSLKSELGNVKSQLTASEEVNEEISFFGISFNKTGYHLMVWSIIVVLAIISSVVYLMYVRSNGLTTRYKKDLEHLRKEFEAHRDKSREIQVRLKRDLQTSVNTIEDMKRGGTRR